MWWVEVFVVFLLCHLAGDYLLQTDWQAVHKHGGLGRDPRARRALLSHIATYMIAFVPALAWLADELGAAVLGVAALVAVPHLIQDDGRLIRAYVARVKRADTTAVQTVALAVDQTFHLLGLFVPALAEGKSG